MMVVYNTQNMKLHVQLTNTNFETRYVGIIVNLRSRKVYSYGAWHLEYVSESRNKIS
jgi:hypothetical protein